MGRAGRVRRAGAGVAAAAVIAGGGVAAGAALSGPGQASAPPAVIASTDHAVRSSYADVARAVVPSVVLIRTPDGLGSGVVLDAAGNIVTNAHVAGAATRFQVQLTGDPTLRSARLIGSYPADDLAVIQPDETSGLKPARFGDSGKVRAGDVVLAVGNPLGLSGSVTEGIVSATGRAVTEPTAAGSPGATLPDAIQTSAPINPGNSGGALVNTAGEVVGIPTLAAGSPQRGAQAQGIGFAISSSLARDIAGQLIGSGHVTRSHRAANGPADQVGLRAGDIIQSIEHTVTPDTTALAQAFAAARPGQAVTAALSRQDQQHIVRITLGELPAG